MSGRLTTAIFDFRALLSLTRRGPVCSGHRAHLTSENVLASIRSLESVLHGKKRRQSHDVSGCLSTLSAYQKEIPESLHTLGDRDVYPYGGHRRFSAMVSRVYGAPFAVPLGSCEGRGECGKIEARQADTQTAAGVVLLRMPATLRDRFMSEDMTCVTEYQINGKYTVVLEF